MDTGRRNFMRRAILGGSALVLSPLAVGAQQGKPRVSKELIEEFVIAGHNDLEKVESMLARHPTLLNCTWDWGGGDFETALGGAGHVGNRDIAEYLITKGARVNLFALTMLGRAELVMPVLEAYPALVFAKGPHGFTMLHHAKQGGERALELHDFLRSRGLSETKVSLHG